MGGVEEEGRRRTWRRREGELWWLRRQAFTRTRARARKFRIIFVKRAGELQRQGRPGPMSSVWQNQPLGPGCPSKPRKEQAHVVHEEEEEASLLHIRSTSLVHCATPTLPCPVMPPPPISTRASHGASLAQAPTPVREADSSPAFIPHGGGGDPGLRHGGSRSSARQCGCTGRRC